jgi:TPR repeat protein
MFNGKGCTLGDGRGCGNLGVSFQVGFGVPPDAARAAHYFELACKTGETRFCSLLGRFEQGANAAQNAAAANALVPDGKSAANGAP